MKTFALYLLPTWLFLATLITLAVTATATKATSYGVVTGSVEAIEGNRVQPNAKAILEFSRKNRNYVAKADNKGQYRISLPSGNLYRARVRGFANCDVSRAAFRIKRGEKLILNFLGVYCPSIEPGNPLPVPLQDISGPDQHGKDECDVSETRPWYYEHIIPADSSSKRSEIMVSFGKCATNSKKTTYFSLDPSAMLPDHRPVAGLTLPATLTVESYTMRADSILFDVESFVFEFLGHVTVEDGYGAIAQAPSAKLTFLNGRPHVVTVNRE